MYMREVGTAGTLYQFVTGQRWHWNTAISVQMLTPFTSSDNTAHTGFTMVVVRIGHLLFTAKPGNYVRPTLVQILF